MSTKTPQEQARDVIDRLVTPEQRERSKRYLDKMLGRVPLDEPPPDDMPAIEKIKIYASAGFMTRYAGTPEEFERIWAEAFPEEKKAGINSYEQAESVSCCHLR